MRSAMLLVGMVSLLTLSSSLASAGGKPRRVPLPDSFSTLDLAAGKACDFHLAGGPVINHEVATTFPADENGDVRQLIRGRLLERLTNVDTGKSIVVDISGPGRFVFHADGSISWDLHGRWLFFLGPTDVPAGPTRVGQLRPNRRYRRGGRSEGLGEPDRQSARCLFGALVARSCAGDAW